MSRDFLFGLRFRIHLNTRRHAFARFQPVSRSKVFPADPRGASSACCGNSSEGGGTLPSPAHRSQTERLIVKRVEPDRRRRALQIRRAGLHKSRFSGKSERQYRPGRTYASGRHHAAPFSHARVSVSSTDRAQSIRSTILPTSSIAIDRPAGNIGSRRQ